MLPHYSVRKRSITHFADLAEPFRYAPSRGSTEVHYAGQSLFHAPGPTSTTIVPAVSRCSNGRIVPQPLSSNDRMNVATEIEKYQALMRYAADREGDFHREIQHQLGVLRSLGVTGAEINNLIHDRHLRAQIPYARAKLAVESVRRESGIIPHGYGKPTEGQVVIRTITQQTEEYLRKTGRSMPRVPPPLAPAPKFLGVARQSACATTRASTQPRAETEPMSQQKSSKKIHTVFERPTPEDSLAVPYGLDPTSNLVHAKDAVKGTLYICPGCDAPLTLRQIRERTTHYAHRPGTACDGEALIHITAKVLVAKVMMENASSTTRVRLRYNCSSCVEPFDKVLGTNAFNGAIVEAQIERFRCDVVALRNDLPVLAVEIFNTHQVEHYKAAALTIPWIEVHAADIVENPYHWKSTNGRLKSMVCPDCREEELKLKTTAARWGLPLSNPPYLAAVAPCWACKADIVWYWWPGVPFAADRPPSPMPSTIKFRHSKMYGGKYWMNVCPGCQAPQGDNFVFLANASPFAHLELRHISQPARVQVQTTGAVSLFLNVLKKNL
jgi:hypothetical protein